VTAGTTVAVGSVVYANSVSGTDSNASEVETRIVANGTDAFELQHRCDTTAATRGFGVEANLATEVYAVVELIKIA
jgi:hypothetical protein